MTDDKAKGRIKVIAWLVALMFIALATRLWFLQVLAAEDYRAQADTNRVRLVPQAATRGRILDSDGHVLVGNRPSIVITLDRREAEEPEQILLRLAGVLDTSAEQLKRRVNSPLYLPYQPIPVYEDAPEAVIYELAEHRADYPGVEWDVQGVRDYPQGRLAVHALGYLAEINEQEVEDPAFRGDRPGTRVGGGGVEQR
jgi:penicillin-binding protein 2